MLSPKHSNLRKYSSGLMECCNKQSTQQMLLHEDLEPLPEMVRNESKQTTESCASSKAEILRDLAKRPSGQKVSLIERRNSMNIETHSKKQTLRPSAFHQTEKGNGKMVGQMVQNYESQHKKQNLGLIQGRLHGQKKTSLRQEMLPDSKRPYLVQFSFMEEFCDSKGSLLKNHMIQGSKKSLKNQPSLMLPFKESNHQNKNSLNLKLGQNLPTYRSEFHNTNETYTKRSEVL